VAIVERGKEGFGVFFPDVPGCTSAGATVLDVIAHDPEVDEIARIFARFDVPGRAVRVNITLPEDLVGGVDRFAKGHEFTRSGLLAQAAREHIRS
jgi:hypothetical protein